MPRNAIASLAAIHDMPADALGTDRRINLPGLSVRVDEMVAALHAVAGEEAVSRIEWKHDPAVERIVGSWPAAWDCRRARALGLPSEADFAAILRAYIEDDLNPAARAALRT